MKTPSKVKAAKPEEAVTFTPFDAAEYLDSEEMIAAYLSEVAESGDAQLLVRALADIARARSMTNLAKESGLGRESLYKSLRPGAKPRFDTIAAIMRAMGLRLSVVPTGAAPTRTRRPSKTAPGTSRQTGRLTSLGRAAPPTARRTKAEA